MTFRHQRHEVCTCYSLDLERITIIVTDQSFFRSLRFPRWKSPKNEWRQQPWDIQTVPTIVRLRDVSGRSFHLLRWLECLISMGT